ncbi:MAG TPA: glycosyltransferase family 4 protein [Casimicrobiaceae bacterium]|nr:glycosyltransferase family 4 protein [Casimicrobiaceae bacterium]
MGAPRRRVICYLTESAGDWGGASRVLFSNLRELDRTRFDPLLLLPSKGPGLPVLDELKVPYLIWGQAHEPRGVLGYARAVARSIRAFRRHRVDLLHINGANYWRPAEIVAARLLRIPVVTHYHVVVDKAGPFIRYSDVIVAVSAYTAEVSEPKSAAKAVVHNSVPVARFDAARDIRAELGLSPSDVVVSFIGQIRSIKGVDLFLRMAHGMPAPGARFLIVGECRDPRRFPGAYTEQRLREEIGDDSRIRFIGYRRDVENVYRASDIVVMPSRGGEPFGLITIEAGASRKPIVATRGGGVPEVIEHGENGFLVEPEDVDGLIRYTTLLAEDPALRKRMGERARQIVEERFTSRPVRDLEKVYDRLLSRAP